MTLTELLTSTDDRKARWGIKRASAYVNSFSGCLDGGACPSSLLGVSGDQWAKCLKEAEERAVYANPAMIVKDFTDSEIGEGAILEFDCVLTTTRKDRDGDILESSGVTIDQNMPLLWQHLPLQPIGKFIRETSRTKRYVQAKCAIADTPLGRDAATLVKFGALRISHGFMPTDFEPLYNEKDQREGWHIRKLDIYEVSTVSVPSNVEAVILTSVEKSKSFAQELDGIRTAYGRGLLKTDAVKQWAKHFHENRPAQGTGIELPVAPETTVSSITYTDTHGEVKTAGAAIEDKRACSCQTKEGHAGKDAGSAKDGGQELWTKMYGEYYLAGSFEAIQSALHRSIRRHMLAAGGDCCCEHDYCYLVATYPDSAIVCVDGYPHGDYYRVSYEMQGDEAVWVGAPVEVEIELSASVTEDAKSRAASFDRSKTTVEQKCFAELLKNTSAMRAFRNRLNVVLDAPSAETDPLSELLSVLA